MEARKLDNKEREDLIKTLKARFGKNIERHKTIKRGSVLARLETNPEKLGPSTRSKKPVVNRMS